MNLVRLIYCSRFTGEMNAPQLQAILATARAFNPTRDITGLLCYGPGLFLQCLEGPRPAINDLYGRILRDPRHKEVTLLEYGETAERMFGDWAMAYIRASDLAPECAGIGGERPGRFNPYAMTAGSAIEFVGAIGRHRDRLS